VDITPNYSIPFPECNPPRVKDAADVGQIAALAYAADAALDAVYAQAEQQVFNPDSVRVQAASVTGTGQDRIPVFTAETFDTGGMSDTSNGIVQIVEPGRYYVGAYTASTTSTLTQLRVRFLINGSPVSNFHTPGYATPLSGSMIAGYADAVLTFQEPGTLSIQIRHSSSGATSWNSTAELWATQLEAF
jgi:hypothetical protein